LRALDGQDVTVDGTRGRVYHGLLPVYEVGGEIDTDKLPATRTKVGLVLADVNQALFLSRLRNVPDFEVGLLRAEFMLGNIGIHPQALEAFDSGELEQVVQEKLKEYGSQLSKILREQMSAGLISIEMKMREYVGMITGLSAEISELSERENQAGTDELLAIHRKMRELDHRLDEYLDRASNRIELLKSSVNLKEHVGIIMGYTDELALLIGTDQESIKRRFEIESAIAAEAARAAELPIVKETLGAINAARHEVALRCGLQREMDDLIALPDKIREIIRSNGFRSGKEHYVQTLSQDLALFAMAFYGKDIIYRTTDFKSNEYRNLVGGNLFEHVEDNPMLGYRGVSRNINDWELEAFKLARSVYGGSNLMLMLPFVRTLEEARSMRRYLEQVHNLKSGKDGLKIILMSELPSNAILARSFIEEFDGFSIGSNDMTQMVLATDRDNARLSHLYDEEDPAVVWAILVTIFTGQKYMRKVGFCGQGVSNSLVIRGLVAIAGIASASVVPDTYAQTKIDMGKVESEVIPPSMLGTWLATQHLNKALRLMEEHGYAHILKKNNTAADLMEWYEGELQRLSGLLRENLESPKERFYRQELTEFRRRFHKPIIYAAWNWNSTVEDALHQAGFASFEEQSAALEKYFQKTW
jgi:pyruvate,water dikinase